MLARLFERAMQAILMEKKLSNRFDLIVIGGGSGGLAHAQRAAEYGARAAVIEYRPLGGTCVNVGCVPKKVMWYAAQHAHHLHHSGDYGFDVASNGHDWAGLKERRDAYVERLNGIYASNLDKRGVTHIDGWAKLVDANIVDVEGQRYEAGRIVIATGGRPIVPDIPGAELGITSDGFFELGEQPRRVLVAGSGYIAVELAGVFNSLGTDTQIVVRKDRVLRSFDTTLSDELMAAMQKGGVNIDTGAIPKSVERGDDGLILHAADGRTFGPVDCLLWAVGREPNTEGIGLDDAGVKTDDRGFVPVDTYQATNVDNVFAIGDVTGKDALTPVAIAAGRRLADRLYGGMEGRHLQYHTIPTVIFSHPPIGTVGLTEDEARAEFGDAMKIYTSAFTPMFYALGELKQRSTMKLITAGPEEESSDAMSSATGLTR
jgi:glutathione reductase (NADPH)